MIRAICVILNILPKGTSELLFQLFFSAIGLFCLCFSVSLSPVTVNTIPDCRNNFQDHRRLPLFILRVKIAADGSLSELISNFINASTIFDFDFLSTRLKRILKPSAHAPYTGSTDKITVAS